MSRIASIVLLTFAGSMAVPAQDAKPAPKSIEGFWTGTLKVSVLELRLGLTIKKKDGALAGTIVSVDQDATDAPLDVVEFKDGAVKLEMKANKAVFEGKLADDGDSIRGRWKQA